MVFKKYALSLFIVLISIITQAQNTYIPDDNFEQALIDLGYDIGPLDDYIPTANINTITDLDVSIKNISDLTGIEDFTDLTILNCSENQLTSLNISQNIKLSQVFCPYNQLTNIDISQNTVLSILWCDNNQITSLNTSNNTELISLICSRNLLTNLDVTQNKKLVVFSCDFNQITNLDITQNTYLSQFVCNYNLLTSIDTSNNLELIRFSCGNNLITSIDVSQNTKLRWLWCILNDLTTLDVTKNPDLEQLTFENNQISSIDLSKNTKLDRLWCSRNLLTEIDTSNNPFLYDISCSNNNIKFLDISSNTNLTNLKCTNNTLCNIDARNGNNTIFELFDASSNPNLSCILVDDVSYSTTNWLKDTTTDFALNENACNGIPSVDVLTDFIGASYTLPSINSGSYFTQSGGSGFSLNTGDVITNSQTIFIYNETPCYYNESNFSVIISDSNYYIPKYFTPNNDGSHDVWKVLDNTNTIESISIFNKYGKLLKYLSPYSEGWNGNFKGKLLQTDDYWYVIKITTGETLKGHFTLKR